MGFTIATHNGSVVAREHNIRNEKVVSKENHIDPHGEHETWVDEKPREAYKRLFGGAVERYNSKQNRENRKITNYYADICKDAKKHPVYEMIISIGNRDNMVDEQTGKEVMRDFVDGWKDRNSNLELIGAYYHADEEGVPHVHCDYIPVAHGYKNGMDTQNGLVKALGEMGFEKKGKATAQIQWEHRENNTLETLCKARGLEIEHPLEENRQHIHTELYKAQQELKTSIEHTNDLEKHNKCLEAKRDSLIGEIKPAEEFKKLKADKGLFGKTKDKVTLDWKTYNNLVTTATAVENVQAHEKSVQERECRVAKREASAKNDSAKAQQALQEAQAIKENAKARAQEQAQRAVNTAMQEFLKGTNVEEQRKIKRMERFLQHIKGSDGKTGLDLYTEYETQVKKNLAERGQKSIRRSLAEWNDYLDKNNSSRTTTHSRDDWDMER